MVRMPSVKEHQLAGEHVAVSDASILAFRRYPFLDSDLYELQLPAFEYTTVGVDGNGHG